MELWSTADLEVKGDEEVQLRATADLKTGTEEEEVELRAKAVL